ncbi:MAG: class I SAM-dependent methyltransferase [Roseiflexaceae bacterium]|nr:class I SAM-dependent methyltransferase [Roseiflexaceae bacterium]
MSSFDAFARFYHADYGSFCDDLPFYRALLRRAAGPAIELMCGSGRLLTPLVREGFNVTGVDISPALLAQAKRNLDAAGIGVGMQLQLGDVRQPLSGDPYAAAFVAINSFMHLATVEDQLAALRHTHAALRPGGLLALDLFNPDPVDLLRHDNELVLDKMFALDDGTLVQKFVAQAVDMATQTSSVTFIYDELADQLVRRTTLAFSMRWLYRYELEHLLARCGFVLEALYGSYNLDAYDQSSPLMLAVAVSV